MGFTHKNTKERLDKIMTELAVYQALHDGDTPAQSVLANELGIPAARVGYYIGLLETEGRVNRISVRPMRLTITEHPFNRATNRRAEKILQAMDAASSVPKAEAPSAEPAPIEEAVALPVEEAAPPSEVVAPPEPMSDNGPEARFVRPPEPTPINLSQLPPPRPMSWNDASILVRSYGGDLEQIATSFIIKTTSDGNLLAELLDRGYTILKTNPSRR